MKLPPNHPELEKAVLGAMLMEKDALTQVINVISEDCFYNSDHQLIFAKGIIPLYAEGKHIDILMVREKLKSQNLLSDSLSVVYLMELTDHIAGGAHIMEHTLLLKEAAIKRNLILFCSKTTQAAYDDGTDSLDLLDETGRLLDKISTTVIDKPFTKIGTILRKSIKQIEAAANNPDSITGVTSGFPALDKVTLGWQKPDLVIMAARPGMGKSALLLNMLENAAIRDNKKSAFFSLEMSKEQLGTRSISSQSSLDLHKLRKGDLSAKDWEVLNNKIAGISEANIYIDDTPSLSIFEMKSRLRKLIHEVGPLDLVGLDYLQLMTAGRSANKNANREQVISQISRGLKEIAKELDVPVIALSQLSRSVETRGGDKKPMLSDLRESGAIEADADIVIFIYRGEYYGITTDQHGNDLTGQAQLIIAKNRNGANGEVRLAFRGELTKFENADQELFEPPF